MRNFDYAIWLFMKHEGTNERSEKRKSGRIRSILRLVVLEDKAIRSELDQIGCVAVKTLSIVQMISKARLL